MSNSNEAAAQGAKIFLQAANYIRQYGWQETGMGEHGKPRCSMGALQSAGPKSRWDESVAKLMYDSLYNELDGISLTQYNAKFRNGDKVADLFEHVATSLK